MRQEQCRAVTSPLARSSLTIFISARNLHRSAVDGRPSNSDARNSAMTRKGMSGPRYQEMGGERSEVAIQGAIASGGASSLSLPSLTCWLPQRSSENKLNSGHMKQKNKGLRGEPLIASVELHGTLGYRTGRQVPYPPSFSANFAASSLHPEAAHKVHTPYTASHPFGGVAPRA
jgi:hypothetical protein